MTSTTIAHPVPDALGRNLFTHDPTLRALLPLYLPADLLAHLQPHLQALGEMAGGLLDTLATTADKHPPTLAHRTRTGIDAQRIVKHPAYVEMEKLAFGHFGLAAMSHRAGVLDWPAAMPPVAKYALTYLFVQAEFGLCCPLSMTDSLARTLRKFGDPALVDRYLPRLTTQTFDDLWQGAMFMTEQGAGSDVAATTTRAQPSADGRSYRLWGDKWFCSNPDAGLAMVLARIDGAPAGMKGISLFLLPRTLDDGSANALRILRLKDKLGTRSMASGEIRLEGAQGWLVGQARPSAGPTFKDDVVSHCFGLNRNQRCMPQVLGDAAGREVWLGGQTGCDTALQHPHTRHRGMVVDLPGYCGVRLAHQAAAHPGQLAVGALDAEAGVFGDRCCE